MSGCDIHLVFTLPLRDSTLKYKRCVQLWNNFPYITPLVTGVLTKIGIELQISVEIPSTTLSNYASQSMFYVNRKRLLWCYPENCMYCICLMNALWWLVDMVTQKVWDILSRLHPNTKFLNFFFQLIDWIFFQFSWTHRRFRLSTYLATNSSFLSQKKFLKIWEDFYC